MNRPTLFFGAPRELEVRFEETTGKPEALFEVLYPVDLTRTHGVEIKLEHLRAMAEAYDPKVLSAALNFDHAWDGPSHGFARELFLQGDRLWARFDELSDEALEGIKSGRWPRRSSEVTLDHPTLRVPYFQGLALLGNARPAVVGLAPAQLLSMPIQVVQLTDNAGAESSAPIVAPETGQEEHLMGTETKPAPAEGTKPATPEQLSAQMAEQTAKMAETQKLLDAQLAAARAATLAARRTASRNEVKEKLDALGTRLTPGVRKEIEPLLVELSAAETQATVELAVSGAADGKVAPVAIFDRILSALAANPENQAIGGRELAGADPKGFDTALTDAEKRGGLTPEKAARVAQKYPDAFGPN